MVGKESATCPPGNRRRTRTRLRPPYAATTIGAHARSERLPGVRRIHLSRIQYYLYYRVSADEIDVLAFWHVSRGSSPPLT